MKNIQKAFLNAQQLLEDYIEHNENFRCIESISQKIADTFLNGGKVIICGNGGSNADAIHFAEEFTGRFKKDRKALPVISISDSSHITCTANDYGYSEVFSRGVEAYGKKGDFFIGISTSGNSENVIHALYKARSLELFTFCLLGKTGGKLKDLADYEIVIPGKTTDRIQELHMLILHVIIETVERILFPENYKI